ncbi:MAG: hypothetical protein ISQ34_00480 [Rickettsiales bacterium]|nr:hypothetical protein [Rickettsiales bacterium]
MAAATLSSPVAEAEEVLWVYTRGTDTRPKGSFEVQLSDVMMKGKSSGKYVRHEIRPGVEIGITDRYTLGARAIIFKHKYSVHNEDLDPMFSTQGGEGGKYNHTTLGGYQIANKYNILSPYKDAIGLSVGLNFEERDRYRLDGANINQKSYVGRLFLQKNWLDDKLVLAVNGITELERRKATGESGEGDVLEEEIAFEVMAGISYRVAPKHFLGFEWRHQRDHLTPTERGESLNPGHQQSNWDPADISVGANHQYANYVGPSYHYAQKDWWFTVGALWQISGGGKVGRGVNGDGKNWDEHERVHVGLLTGFEF